MILNDGKHIVDTDTSVLIGTTESQKEGDGYSHETHSIYRLWESRKGNYFITRDYVEYINLFCFFSIKTSVKGVVVYVYDIADEARKAWLMHGGVAPSKMMIET